MYANYACPATSPIAEQHRCVAGIESIPRSVAEVRTRELRVEDEEANGGMPNAATLQQHALSLQLNIIGNIDTCRQDIHGTNLPNDNH